VIKEMSKIGRSVSKLQMIRANRRSATIILGTLVIFLALGWYVGIKTDRLIESMILAVITSATSVLLLFYGSGRAQILRMKR